MKREMKYFRSTFLVLFTCLAELIVYSFLYTRKCGRRLISAQIFLFYTHTHRERERERERERQTDRQTDTERERVRERETESTDKCININYALKFNAVANIYCPNSDPADHKVT